MSAEVIVARLRRLLLALSAFVCLGTVVELLFAGHYKETLQFIPFVLCILGFLASGAVLLRPSRRTIWLLRFVMIAVAGGSLLGIYLHLTTNLAFELEIRPNATIGDVLLEAMQGASPLLAPGILALVAVLAIAATCYHPMLKPDIEQDIR